MTNVTNTEITDTKEPSVTDMTLRDHFAACALPGLLADLCGIDFGELAAEAYGIADAMLAEREKRRAE